MQFILDKSTSDYNAEGALVRVWSCVDEQALLFRLWNGGIILWVCQSKHYYCTSSKGCHKIRRAEFLEKVQYATASVCTFHVNLGMHAVLYQSVPLRQGDTIKWHFCACDKLMWICQNRPLDKLMQFLFIHLMHSNIWSDKNLCGTNLCNLHLTRIIIRINKFVQ